MSESDERISNTKMQNSKPQDEYKKTNIFFEIKKSSNIFGYKVEIVDYILFVLFVFIAVIGYIAIDQKIDIICGYIIPYFTMGITLFIFISYLWYVFKFIINYLKNK